MELCEKLDLPRPFAVCRNNHNCSVSQQAYADQQDVAFDNRITTPGIHAMASFCSAPISTAALGFYEALGSKGDPHFTFVFALEYKDKNGGFLRWKIYRRLRQFELLREELKKLVTNSNMRLPKLPGVPSQQGFSMRGLVGSRSRSDESPAAQQNKLRLRLGDLHQWLADVIPLIHGLLRNNKLPTPTAAHWLNSANGRAMVLINCFLFSGANFPSPAAAPNSVPRGLSTAPVYVNNSSSSTGNVRNAGGQL